MALRKFHLVAFSVLLSFHAWSQQYEGQWKGQLQSGKKTYSATIDINQDQKVLTGTVEITGKKDSSKYYYNGVIEDEEIRLFATQFIYKKGLHCLPKIKLTGSQQELSGTWGANAVWGGCLPGISGNIAITRTNDTRPELTKAPEAPMSMAIDDFEGNELIKALKERTYYALVIAINDYPDENIPSLEQPIGDAQQLIDALATHYTFEKENITFLKNPGRTQLIDAFDELSQKVKERDNLLIFYAGHGIWDEQLKQGFWLPSDASKASKSQWLSNGTIRDYIRAIKSKHTLLIADACFGGSILKERAVFFNGKAMLEMYKRPSRKAMTSGALSTVPDQSVFIKYLVKNLSQNRSPLISAEQVYSEFKVAVINNSETGQVPQYGAISLAGDEGGDFIFLKRNF